LPKTTVVAVCASRNEENTHAYKSRLPRWPTIWGMAVDTIVASIAIMNDAAMTEASTRGRFGAGERDIRVR